MGGGQRFVYSKPLARFMKTLTFFEACRPRHPIFVTPRSLTHRPVARHGCGVMLRFALLFLTLLAHPAPSRADTQMELHLVLAFDVSASVNDAEYALQIHGTAEALRSFRVRTAIEQAQGGIAMSVVQWSSIRQQAVSLDWVVLHDTEDIDAFANALDHMPRILNGGGTMIHAGLDFAAEMFTTAPGQARRKVIDLSGNGRTDDTEKLLESRDRLNREGIVINGLAIEEDHRDLTQYFYQFVIGGDGAFVETAADFPVFERAMENKLYREINGPAFAALD